MLEALHRRPRFARAAQAIADFVGRHEASGDRLQHDVEFLRRDLEELRPAPDAVRSHESPAYASDDLAVPSRELFCRLEVADIRDLERQLQPAHVEMWNAACQADKE